MTTTRFTSDFSEHERAIGHALERAGDPVTDIGRGHWRMMFGENGASAIDVRMHGGWVVCFSPLEHPFAGPVTGLENYLRVNTRLGGQCKVVLDPARTTPLGMREEIALVDGVGVAQACTDAVANLAAAKKILATLRGPTHRERKKVALPEEVADTIEQACAVIGFGHRAKDTETSVVTLDGPNGSYKAAVTAHASGECRITAHLGRHRSLSSLGRRALAVFLLTANGLVRFARAGIQRSAGTTTALFEVKFSGPPSVALMETALSALAAACGLCGRELAVLSDDSVARRYLAAREVAAATAKQALTVPADEAAQIVL